MIPLRDYQPSGTFPVLTIAIIAINLLVFLYQFMLSRSEVDIAQDSHEWVQEWKNAGCHVPPEFADQLVSARITATDLFALKYGTVPCKITHGQDLPPYVPFSIWLTLLTAMFLHGGIIHVLGNMWYMWIFGDNVEDTFGRVKFLMFYLVSGLVAALTQISADSNGVLPMIGASGAIAGVLGAYMILFPYGRVLTLMPFYFVVQVPAEIVLGIWFVLQFIGAIIVSANGGGVAYWAHIGGFLTGAVMALVLKFVRRI